MNRSSSIRAVVILAAAPLLLSGCGALVQSGACVSWVGYETPQDAFDDAALVIVGEAAPASGTADLFGVPAAVHRVEITEILKGQLPDAEPLDVAATPVTCTGGEIYPDGDPLDADGQLILFLTLHDTGQGWRLMTPDAGVLPMPDDGILPFDPEGGTG